jgi:nicotinamide mononucleotide transporter
MDLYIEIAGTVIGLVYLWLEYKASAYMWLAGIVMPAIYLYIYYNAGLYADFGINVYYLVIAVYGWLAWKNVFGGNDRGEELPVTYTPRRGWFKAVLMYVVTQTVITWLLLNHTDSTVPVADSFTTALSIVGMWMLARKYIEQWWVWCVVDVASSVLYVYKGLYFTAILYALYAIIAIFGYFKWKTLMRDELAE